MTGPSRSTVLELVSALADDREAVEHRFKLALVTARAAGEPLVAIADAARLSTSRANAIIERHGSSGRVLTRDQIERILERAFTVGIVPAGKLALDDYDELGAYICQPNRPFRHEMDHVGFYARREISPHFAKIRMTWPAVPFTPAAVEQLRSTGDPLDLELAVIIETVLAAPPGRRHRPGPHKVILLTRPGDPDTITLRQPITHLSRGRGQAFVRRQRYTTAAAVRRQPTTTEELLRYERE